MGTIWHSLLARVRSLWLLPNGMNKGSRSPSSPGVSLAPSPSVSHPALYLSFLHTNKLMSGWIHICKDIQQFYGFPSPVNGLRWMWPLDVCTANTSHATVPVFLWLAVQEKTVHGTNNTLHFYFLVFLLWKSRALAGWTFPLCSFIWMRVMQTVCFLLLPCEIPVAPWLSPEVKMDYCRRTACPALPFTHFTHTTSPLSASSTREAVRMCTHTHHTHKGLKALTGLLAKGQSQIWQIFL